MKHVIQFKSGTRGRWKSIPGIEILDGDLARDIAKGMSDVHGIPHKAVIVGKKAKNEVEEATEASYKDIQDAQRKAADAAYEAWDFGAIVEAADGWDIAGEDWTRNVYVRGAYGLPSIKVRFGVTFQDAKSTVVLSRGEF